MIPKRVAVIIPTYNEEHFIGACLDSVLSQSFPSEDMDIMVVDGRSHDKTREVVSQYIKRFPNIRLLDNPKKIQSAAFNIGVRNSESPYIVRLDAHALYGQQYIENCVKHLERSDNYGNVGGVWIIKPQNSSFQAQANAILNQLKFGIGGASFRIGSGLKEVETVPFGAFPRGVIEKIGMMREDLPRGEDNEYNSRIRKKGFKILLDPNIVSTYFARPTLWKSVIQMYRNGLSIGWLFHIDMDSISIRHLIPLCFVLSLIVTTLISCIFPIVWFLPLILLAIYFIAAIIASVGACHKFGYKYFFILPIMFFCIHIAYGYGTIIGLMRRPKLHNIASDT